MLTDDDLLEIIRAPPPTDALSAISRRAEVAVGVSDAIVATEDEAAITSLLSNASAQIREETLDYLIDSAPGIEAWHEPLVRRLQLPSCAARHLANFVVERLIRSL